MSRPWRIEFIGKRCGDIQKWEGYLRIKQAGLDKIFEWLSSHSLIKQCKMQFVNKMCDIMCLKYLPFLWTYNRFL